MESNPKHGDFLIVNDSKLHFDFVKGYYQTGLLAVLTPILSTADIISSLRVALLAVFGGLRFGSDSELRDRLFDLVFTSAKFPNSDDEKKARTILNKCYNLFWGLPKEAKKAIALIQNIEHYPALLERLDRFARRLESQGELETAQAVQRMFTIIEKHYLGLHEQKMKSRNHLHNF